MLLIAVCCVAAAGCGPVKQSDKDAKAGCADIHWLVQPDNIGMASTVVEDRVADGQAYLHKAALAADRYKELSGAFDVLADRVASDKYFYIADAPATDGLQALDGPQGCGKWF